MDPIQSTQTISVQEGPFRRAGIEYQPVAPRGYSRASTIDVGEFVAKELKYTPGDELPPILKRIGGELEYVDFPLYETTNRSGSILVHGERDFTVVLPNFTSPLRDRFSIAHEIGHYFLHSGQGERPIYAERFGSSRTEWEANWFAAGFLMPAREFSQSLQERGLTETAYKFRVSIRAATVRRDTIESDTQI